MLQNERFDHHNAYQNLPIQLERQIRTAVRSGNMANNKKHQQDGTHVHQLLTKTNAQDPLAGYHQQRQSLGKSKPSASGGRGQEKKIGLDRPHIAETIIQRHPPGLEMEFPGQEKTRETKEHVEN